MNASSSRLEAATDRSRLFVAVRDLLGALGGERRTALVVEDLHWADAGTVDLLTFLLRKLPAGTALVVTSRRDELPVDDRARDWLTATSRLPLVVEMSLAPLSNVDVEELVASLVDGEPAGSFVADVLRRGEGNPFFTEQLVASAGDAGQPAMASTPPAVAQMLLRRVRAVGASASEVSAALAVAARPLTEDELVSCLGAHVDVATGLQELLTASLVEHAQQDRFRLRHALLEETVLSTLLASERVPLHRGIAGVLAAREDEPVAGEVAAHWAAAGNRVEEARWSVPAARQAERVFAWREASLAWRRVWDLCASGPQGDQPSPGLVEAAVACVSDAWRADDNAAFLALAERALADDDVTGDAQAHGTLLNLYGYRLALTDVAAGIAALQQAVAIFDTTGEQSTAQAHALRNLVQVKTRHGLATGTEEDELDRAEMVAAELGNLELRLVLAGDRAADLVQVGRVEEGLTQLSDIVSKAGEDGVGTAPLFALIVLTDTYLWGLRLSEGIAVGHTGVEWAVERGHRETSAFSVLVANAADCLLLSGDAAAAARLVARFLSAEPTEAGWALHQLQADIDIRAGNLTIACSRADAIAALGYHNDEMTLEGAAIRMEARLWQSRPRSAWEVAEQVSELVPRFPRANRASRFLALAARAAADMADQEPEAQREDLARQLQAQAEQAQCFARHPARVLGAAYGATFEAELARLCQTSDQEVACESARDVWGGHQVPHLAAYAGWRRAEGLLDAGRRKAAEDELRAAYRAAEGHVPLREAIEGMARRARLTLASDLGVSVAPADDTRASAPFGLTARELDVLRLLGTGATNAEIGRRLYMSPKTASVHVTAILRKLGVTGRVQAATVAERMGLLDQK